MGLRSYEVADALKQRFFTIPACMDKLSFCVQVLRDGWDCRGSAGSSGVYLAVASI
jgi:hypothetical protein